MDGLTLVNADDLLGWSGEGWDAPACMRIGQLLDDGRWGVSPLYDLFLKKLGLDPSAPLSPGPGPAADGIIG